MGVQGSVVFHVLLHHTVRHIRINIWAQGTESNSTVTLLWYILHTLHTLWPRTRSHQVMRYGNVHVVVCSRKHRTILTCLPSPVRRSTRVLYLWGISSQGLVPLRHLQPGSCTFEGSPARVLYLWGISSQGLVPLRHLQPGSCTFEASPSRVLYLWGISSQGLVPWETRYLWGTINSQRCTVVPVSLQHAARSAAA